MACRSNSCRSNSMRLNTSLARPCSMFSAEQSTRDEGLARLCSGVKSLISAMRILLHFCKLSYGPGSGHAHLQPRWHGKSSHAIKDLRYQIALYEGEDPQTVAHVALTPVSRKLSRKVPNRVCCKSQAFFPLLLLAKVLRTGPRSPV